MEISCPDPSLITIKSILNQVKHRIGQLNLTQRRTKPTQNLSTYLKHNSKTHRSDHHRDRASTFNKLIRYLSLMKTSNQSLTQLITCTKEWTSARMSRFWSSLKLPRSPSCQTVLINSLLLWKHPYNSILIILSI